MDDLISRQAAIDALGDKPLAWTEGEYELGLQQQWEADVNAIKALPSAQQWIPCSEKLPEKNGRYLVTRGLKACNSIWNRVYIVNYTDLMGLIAEKIWWEGNVGKSDFQKIDDVIAWKLLEEPYKGEQE